MADTDRIGSRSVRMTSEEIVQRGFASKVRGISETDVRSFLKRVAEEVERLAKREDELMEKVSNLQESLKAKPKATKAELLESLGEQTTLVLSSAQEAAEQMIAEAKEQSQKAIASAKEKSEQVANEARKKADELVLNAESRAKSLEERTKRDSEMVISQARTKGRELFQESVVVRERILKDLLRRRDLLIEQIDELRTGREELLESYKVVKGSFQKATDALQSVEHRATSELEENPIDVDELLKAPVELPSSLDSSKPLMLDNAQESDQLTTNSETLQANERNSQGSAPLIYDQSKEDKSSSSSEKKNEEVSQSGKRKTLKKYVKEALGADGEIEDTEIKAVTSQADSNEALSVSPTGVGEVKTIPAKRDVGALFESLKSQNEKNEESNEIDLAKEEAIVKSDSSKDAQNVNKDSKKSSNDKKKISVKKDPVAFRNDTLNSVATTILRKAKRQLQDEQNELLESLRTVKSKKRVSSESVLPEEQSQIKNWTESLRSELENVFSAGAMTVGSKKEQVSEEVLKSSVQWIISPLRETLIVAIDEGEVSESASRVGAKYREWRNSDLKNALYDALSCAYNNGVLSAVKGDTTLQWRVEKSGQCPDCDDNALEPTPAGETFPTGQIAPPAHSGCRCVISIA